MGEKIWLTMFIFSESQLFYQLEKGPELYQKILFLTMETIEKRYKFIMIINIVNSIEWNRLIPSQYNIKFKWIFEISKSKCWCISSKSLIFHRLLNIFLFLLCYLGVTFLTFHKLPEQILWWHADMPHCPMVVWTLKK